MEDKIIVRIFVGVLINKQKKMETNFKYVIYDALEKCYLGKIEDDVRYWTEFVDESQYFNTEEEAWNNAGNYCTVLKIRFN